MNNVFQMPLVIYLPRIHVSVTYRPWLLAVKERTILEVAISNIRCLYGCQDLIILCHGEEPPIIRGYVEDLGAKLLISSLPTATEAYSQVSEVVASENVAFARLELLFAPPEVLWKAAAYHISSANDITVALGLPPLVAPEIYSRRALNCLPAVQRNTPVPIDPCFFFRLFANTSELRGPSDESNMRIGSITLQLCYPDTDNAEVSDDIDLFGHPAIGCACAELLDSSGTRVTGDPWFPINTWRSIAAQEHRLARRKHFETRTPDAVAWRRTERRRILFASHSSGYSGAEVSFRQLISRLDQARYEAHCVVALEGHFANELRSICTSVRVPNRAFDTYSFEHFTYCRELLDDIKPALVHSNGYLGNAMLSALAAMRVPLVQHVRVAQVDTLRSELAHADAIVAISQFVKQRILTLGVSAERVAVIGNPLDTDRLASRTCDRRALRDELGVPDDALVLVMIARFTPYKRHDLLIEALRQCRHQLRSPVRVFLIGEVDDGEYYLAMRHLMNVAGIDGLITHIPFTPHVSTYLAVADMLILCSAGEPLGRCILEAMAAGVPVISSDSGGPREIIESGVTGLLFPCGDAGCLSDAIVTLAKDQNLGRAMATEALALVGPRFSPSLHAAAVTRLYETVLSSI